MTVFDNDQGDKIPGAVRYCYAVTVRLGGIGGPKTVLTRSAVLVSWADRDDMIRAAREGEL